MKVLLRHLTPFERLVRKSFNITKASTCPEECLNHRSEWGGSKLPDLQVQTPKGVSKVRDPRKGDLGPQETDLQGEKRIQDRKGEEEVTGLRPSKRNRSSSPGKLTNRWKETPTFNTDSQETEEERDAARKPGPEMEIEGQEM